MWLLYDREQATLQDLRAISGLVQRPSFRPSVRPPGGAKRFALTRRRRRGAICPQGDSRSAKVTVSARRRWILRVYEAYVIAYHAVTCYIARRIQQRPKFRGQLQGSECMVSQNNPRKLLC